MKRVGALSSSARSSNSISGSDPSFADFAKAAFAECNDAIFVVDPTTLRILDANPAAVRFTGCKKPYLQESTIDLVIKGVNAARMTEMERACRETTFFHSKDQYLLRTARDVDIKVNVTITRVHIDPPIAMLVVRDVSEQMAAQEALQEANSRLRELNEQLQASQTALREQVRLRAFQEMAGGVAHDLNNTLSPILIFTDLLLAREDLSDDAREQVVCVSESAIDAARIVEDLGVFDLAKRSMKWERVSLTQVLQRVTETFQQSTEFGPEYSIKFAASEEPALVRGDSSDLRRVVHNLIRNSLASMPNGGQVTLDARRDGDTVIVEVADTGVGMSEAERAKCFDSFYTTKSGGTGLGLAVCARLIGAHGGEIEASSEPDHGTVMRVRLPGWREQPDVAQSIPHNAGIAALRVLYIDDDPAVRESVRVLLQTLNVSVTVADSGASGLRLVEHESFDIVLTDFTMPDMNGAEVLARVRELHPSLPIIIVSGKPQSSIQEALGDELKLDGFLNKIELSRGLIDILNNYVRH